MFKPTENFKTRLSGISAKTLSLGGKQYLRARNEQKIKYQQEYVHEPLSGPRCIRLLTIDDGHDTEVISCKLFEVNLDDTPRPIYEALSYSWNLDNHFDLLKFTFMEDEKFEERPILCNGQPRHVTMNLYHCLAELRRQKFTTPLWADQICIWQTNNTEKFAQLKIMAEIYTSAKRVTVWLGKINAFLKSALDFMEKLTDDRAGAKFDAASVSMETRTNILSNSMEAISILGSSVTENYRWLAIYVFLHRNWFRRAWTLQEFLLASDIRMLMGPREVSFEAVRRGAFQLLDFYTNDPLTIASNLGLFFSHSRAFLKREGEMFAERIEFQQGRRYSAEEYLAVIRVRLATVSKDKVIAGQALLRNGPSMSTVFPMTTLEIFMAFASECLWPELGIAALSLVGAAAGRIDGLPTWAPDLGCRLRPDPLEKVGAQVWSAPLGARGVAHPCRIEGKILHLKGIEYDTVDVTGEAMWAWGDVLQDPYNSSNNIADCLQTSTAAHQERLGYMFAIVQALGPKYRPTGEITTDAFWQTLIGGSHVSFPDDGDFDAWRGHFQRFFARAIAEYKYSLAAQREKSKNTLIPGKVKQWLVPMVAELDQFDRRLEDFLSFYDGCRDVVDTDPDRPVTLRGTTMLVSTKFFGRDYQSQAKTTLREDLSALSGFRDMAFIQSVGIFIDRFGQVYGGRRIFRSQKGYLGLGNESIRKDDKIFLLEGAKVPYVFRPVTGAEKTYTFVGEAYVHGIMMQGDDLIKDLALDELRVI